jgi:hypothetical protein
VHNGGAIYPVEYGAEFADEFGIPNVCDRPEDMIGKVDAVIIHSCNWDAHVGRARPFVEANVPVLIDKPMVGKVRDAQTFIDWADAGHVITGGSSLRYAVETAEFLAKPKDEMGAVHTAFAGCGVDDFNYGIHAYANLFGLMGVGCASVRYLGTHVQDQYELTWADGRRGIITVGATAWLPSYLTAVTEKKVVQIMPDLKRIYRALLEHDLPILAGECPAAPMRDLLEPELAAIAGLVSKQQNGARVAISELGPDDAGYDGGAFARGYREKCLPKYLQDKQK